MAEPEDQQEQQAPRLQTPFNFGLTRGDGSSVPLKGVSVDIKVLDFLAEVTLEQSFVNPTEAKEALEITYRFPLDAEAVLRGFTVELEDGTVVKGQVQEKEKAADTYDDALASGHGGFLLQEDNEMKDVFSLRVGNLPPGGSATVRLTYVAQIDEEVPEEAGGNSVVRFVLPTAVAPRYSPAGDQPPELYQHAAALLADWPKDLLKIKGTVTAASPILALYPHTFKEETSLELAGSNTASFALTAGHLDEDFVLSVHLQGTLPDRAWVDKASGAASVAVGLRPGQMSALLNEAEAEAAEGQQGEFVFVIDRSGSMQGTSILQAQEALALCVSALPLGARFQVVGFGNYHVSLFPDGPAAFDDARKAEAVAHCQGLEADMGGTEILRPLRAIAEQTMTTTTTAARQVFVITDGQVCNTAGVLAFVKDDHQRNGTRYFSLGIGGGASRALVKGIAERGGGTSAFVVEGERLQRKVMAQMNRALEPSLMDVRVVVRPPLRMLKEEGEAFSPKKPRALFSGARLLYFGALDPASLAGATEGEGLIAVAGTGPGAHREVSLPVPVRFVAGEEEGRLLHALATRALLRDLEAEEEEAAATEEAKASLKAQAVKMSERTGTLCKWTSYVAVAERKDAAMGALKPVHLPLAFVNKANQGDPWSYMQRGMMRQHTGAIPPPPGGVAMASMCAMPMAMPMGSPPMAACYASMAPMAPAPRALVKRGAPMMHRVLGHTAKVMDTTAEAADAAAAMGADDAVMDHVALVARQKAAGDWAWEEGEGAFLPRALGLASGEKLRAALDTQAAPLGAWATALVLAMLSRDFGGFAEEWEAAARKARRWLGKQPLDGLDVDGFVKRAGEILAAVA